MYTDVTPPVNEINELNRIIESMEKKIDDLKRIVETLSLLPYKREQFQIDGIDKWFTGYTEDESWNGFAAPHFTFQDGMEIVKAYSGTFGIAFYDHFADAFAFIPSNTGEVEYYGGWKSNEDAPTLYPIGYKYWCWSQIR